MDKIPDSDYFDGGDEKGWEDNLLNTDQEGSLTTQHPAPNAGTDIDADQLAHDPAETSKKLPLDDTQKTITPDSCEGDIFAEVIPKDVKPDSEEEKAENET